MTPNQIINTDCLVGLHDVGDDSIDCIVTDPPYGYSFMGKDWDKATPSVDIWKECLRVLKPGAFAFIMSAPRLDVQTQMAQKVSDAGFRTDFTPIYWTYASGFPKATNISKAVDKRLGIVGDKIPASGVGFMKPDSEDYHQTKNQIIMPPASTPQAKALDGSYAGFQPKPAVEVIIVAMKPLSEKTYVDQALANGKGITWLDDCKIPCEHRLNNPMGAPENSYGGYAATATATATATDGRFPANLLISDGVLDDGRKHIGTGGLNPQKPSEEWTPFHEETNRPYFNYGDSGGFSRYFSLDAWYEKNISQLPKEIQKTFPFLITPKASKSEKNEGCDNLEERTKWLPGGGGAGITERENIVSRNNHPTVKPLELMSYLITLGSRPGDLIMDPFAGSGTTLLAAKQLARTFIGFEIVKEYKEIAEARLRDALKQRTILDFAEAND